MTWTPTNTIGPDWGNIRVAIGGKDVTWFRGIEAKVQGWQHTDPYGPNNATITFPQVTVYDDRDNDPALAWLHEGARVVIDHVLDGAVVNRSDPPFFGIVDSVEETDGSAVVTCSGNFNGRLALMCHQPQIMRRDARKVGTELRWAIGGGWGTRSAGQWIHLYPRADFDAGFDIASNGSRDMTRLGRIEQILGEAVTEAGESVTILPHPTKGRGAYLVQWRQMKDTPDATVHAGAHGIKLSLRRDLVDMVTSVYGEGVAPNGERWHNSVYPNLGPERVVPPYPNGTAPMTLGMTNADTTSGDGISAMARELAADGFLSNDDRGDTFTDEMQDAVKDLQRRVKVTVDGQMTPSLWNKLFNATYDHLSFREAHYEPLAVDDRTQKWLRSADGTLAQFNPDFDRSLTPVEQFESFGENVSKRHARRNARGTVNRTGARTGTLTLTSDPAEMSRFDLRAGMTIAVKHHRGGTTNLYVSSVQVDWSSEKRPVTLAVSTKAKHYIDLATIKQRQMEARQDPAKQWRHQLRRSAQVADSSGGWEGESGAGIVRRHELTAGWNVFPVVGAQFGVMSNIHLQTTDPTPFIFAVFADRVHEGVLANRLGNPFNWIGTAENQRTTFTEHADWLVDNERLMIEAWGTPDQPCGFGRRPHMKDGKVTDAPVTGHMHDDGSWDFATEHGLLWLAVYVQSACSIKGRFKVQITGEGA